MKEYEFSIKVTVFGTVKVIATDNQEAEVLLTDGIILRFDEPQIKNQSDGNTEIGILECSIDDSVILELEQSKKIEEA